MSSNEDKETVKPEETPGSENQYQTGSHSINDLDQIIEEESTDKHSNQACKNEDKSCANRTTPKETEQSLNLPDYSTNDENDAHGCRNSSRKERFDHGAVKENYGHIYQKFVQSIDQEDEDRDPTHPYEIDNTDNLTEVCDELCASKDKLLKKNILVLHGTDLSSLHPYLNRLVQFCKRGVRICEFISDRDRAFSLINYVRSNKLRELHAGQVIVINTIGYDSFLHQINSPTIMQSVRRYLKNCDIALLILVRKPLDSRSQIDVWKIEESEEVTEAAKPELEIDELYAPLQRLLMPLGYIFGDVTFDEFYSFVEKILVNKNDEANALLEPLEQPEGCRADREPEEDSNLVAQRKPRPIEIWSHDQDRALRKCGFEIGTRKGMRVVSLKPEYKNRASEKYFHKHNYTLTTKVIARLVTVDFFLDDRFSKQIRLTVFNVACEFLDEGVRIYDTEFLKEFKINSYELTGDSSKNWILREANNVFFEALRICFLYRVATKNASRLLGSWADSLIDRHEAFLFHTKQAERLEFIASVTCRKGEHKVIKEALLEEFRRQYTEVAKQLAYFLVTLSEIYFSTPDGVGPHLTNYINRRLALFHRIDKLPEGVHRADILKAFAVELEPFFSRQNGALFLVYLLGAFDAGSNRTDKIKLNFGRYNADRKFIYVRLLDFRLAAFGFDRKTGTMHFHSDLFLHLLGESMVESWKCLAIIIADCITSPLVKDALHLDRDYIHSKKTDEVTRRLNYCAWLYDFLLKFSWAIEICVRDCKYESVPVGELVDQLISATFVQLEDECRITVLNLAKYQLGKDTEERTVWPRKSKSRRTLLKARTLTTKRLISRFRKPVINNTRRR